MKYAYTLMARILKSMFCGVPDVGSESALTAEDAELRCRRVDCVEDGFVIVILDNGRGDMLRSKGPFFVLELRAEAMLLMKAEDDVTAAKMRALTVMRCK